MVSQPPAITRSLVPRRRQLAASDEMAASATRREAASTVKFTPPKSNRLLTRPADVEQDAGEAVLGPFRELAHQALVGVQDVARHMGPHRVLGAEIGHAAAHAENDAGARAVVAVPAQPAGPGVPQGAIDQLEREELGRLDARDGRGRDAVLHRIEQDVADEAAPAAVDPIARLRIEFNTPRLPIPQHHVIAVNHLGTAAIAEQRFEIG
jgi:hypothetical protein